MKTVTLILPLPSPPTATLKRSGVISHVRITESSLVRYEVNSE